MRETNSIASVEQGLELIEHLYLRKLLKYIRDGVEMNIKFGDIFPKCN